MTLFVVISGCSGGGKSTLLSELGRRGYVVVQEPGRRIVARALATGGSALPWADAAAFARRALELAAEDRQAANLQTGLVFFDRGLIDAAVALEHAGDAPAAMLLAEQPRYHRQVFLAPPWQDIYVADAARRLGFDAGLAEYERLSRAYPDLGYEVLTLPKTSVGRRADFVLDALARGERPA